MRVGARGEGDVAQLIGSGACAQLRWVSENVLSVSDFTWHPEFMELEHVDTEELLDALERNAASEASQVDRALQIGAIFHKMAFALILCTCFRSSRNAPLIRVSHLDVLLWNGVGPQIGSTSQTITQLTAR